MKKFKILSTTNFFIFFFGLLSFLFIVPAEDAAILFEYSKNFASNGIITYGRALTPIEGATDFLWMLIISILKIFNIDEFFSSLVLGLSALIYISQIFKNDYIKFLFLIFWLLTPFLYAGLQGFSVIFFTSFYLYVIYLFFKKSKYLYFSILIFCLIRPDGVFLSAGIVFLNLFQSKSKIEFKSEIVKCFKQLIIPGILYFVFRFIYFQNFFPLPFYVKTSSEGGRFFLFYFGSILIILKSIIPTLACMISYNKKKYHTYTFLCIFILPLIFYSMTTLSQNIGNRFMAPIAFGSFYLIYKFYGKKSILLFIFLWFVISLKDTVITINDVFSSNKENIFKLSKDLNDISGKMLVTEAGRLAYYNNWVVEDAWGLNTPKYTRHLISAKDIGNENYDLIVAHCDLFLFKKKENLVHSYHDKRNWDNMCKNIVQAIHNGNFTIYLVPFYNSKTVFENIKSLYKGSSYNPNCVRHDIYAISNTYLDFQKLKKKLIKINSILYKDNLLIKNKDLVCR